jgi:hypothetical protein
MRATTTAPAMSRRFIVVSLPSVPGRLARPTGWGVTPALLPCAL